jgi:molybdopterin-containing oxidoreductase family iron-sulfur binding subunit
VNLIPPRLREKIDEISRMGKNPDVSVRMRGVMEKCSFCVQRINAARVETKLKGMANIPDGFFEAACQQACPSNAIVFGDMLDPESRVHATRGNARSYQLLNYLNTRPRTSHMLRVMNPNPVLCDEKRKHAWDHPFHGADHDAEGHGSEGHGSEGRGGPEGGSSGGHSFHYEPGKKRGDSGYALSLNVLNQVNA